MSTEPQRPTQSAPEVPGQRDQPPVQQPSPGQASPKQPPPDEKIKRTKAAFVWIAIGAFAVVLLLLLVFILENSNSVDVSYFGAHGRLPLGVALLLAAVCGVLLTVAAGTVRILQLRMHARKQRKAAAAQASAGPPS